MCTPVLLLGSAIVVASGLNPDSPDEIAFGRLHAPIPVVRSSSYAGSSSRILTDPTGESKESTVWSAFPRLSALPVQSIRGIRAQCHRDTAQLRLCRQGQRAKISFDHYAVLKSEIQQLLLI